MAIQILPREQSFGASLGASLGSGLGQGLSMLAQNKMHQISTEHKSKAWQSIGLDPDTANFIVSQPEWLQKELVGRLEGLGQQQSPQVSPGAEGENVQQSLQAKPTVKIGMSADEKKRSHEDQKGIIKEVYPYIKEVQSQAKVAKENDLRLNRMEKLIETGKLNNPQYASLLKTLKKGVWGVGLDLTSLLSKESQEFEKISNDFIKGAKGIFGSRITDADLQYFLSTIPNLSQSNEGKSAVIRNLKLMNKAAEIKANGARELLRHYNNKPPLDFESQVDDLIKPQIDAIASEFEKGSSVKPKKTSTLVGDFVGSIGESLLGNS